ncbi:MAG: aminopeptidase P family protein [Thermovibrio sp.]|nr:MAG: aminopeptidase P family protein [Thermovibrio sp.]
MRKLEFVCEKLGERERGFLSFDESENFYLTGFRSTFSIVLITGRERALLFTDGRYIERAKEEVKGFEVVEWKGWDEFNRNLKEEVEEVIVDPERIKASTLKKIEVPVIEEEGFLRELRSVKTPEEVSLITRAVQIAEISLKSVLHLLKPGITEVEFRRELLSAFFKFGGEGEAFPTIVASGRNSAIPHWETGSREIKDGDVVIVDFGTVYRGYVSDITRTFLIGNVPTEMREVYEAVREAQEVGIGELKPGKSCSEVDLKVREFLEKKGLSEYFVHSLGHGIGVEVHESPTLSRRSREVLRRGNVVTVEPGVYIPGLGGVRIEDDCLITEEGAFQISSLEK